MKRRRPKESIEPGRRVVRDDLPAREKRELAGKFGSFVGTLSPEEAAEMQATIDGAFESISDDW
jgi:hypothetical protein